MSAVLQAPVGGLPGGRQSRAFLRWFFWRSLGALGALWAAASFAFVLQSLMPGDRATLIINMAAGNLTTPSVAEIAAINARYGFDASLPVQYLRYLWALLHGDFGVSYQQHKPVLDLIAAQILPTVTLAVSALATAWVIAVLVTVTSTGRDNWFSKAASSAQVVLATVPPYWIGTILLVVFAVELRWFPVEGKNSLLGLVLPTLSLALPLAGYLGQVLQDEFARVLEQPFVTSARTRGMGDLGVRWRHVLRHAVLPGVTLSGWAVGKLFSGAVLIEAVFARQGLGSILVSATSARDVPLVTGVVLISAAIYVATNLLVDRTYRAIDPRIKLT